MAFRKFPPKGYKMEEYPLPHSFEYRFALDMLDATADATCITLIRMSTENTGSPELIEVNPKHTDFAECNGPTVHKGSIIPKMSFSLNAFIGEAAATQIGGGDKKVLFNWLPIYTAFENTLDATDEVSGLAITAILELAKDAAAFETVVPLFVDKLTNATSYAALHPLTTEPPNITDETFDDWGLSTNALPEQIAFDKDLYFDIMRFGTNASMLKKVAPRMNTGVVSGNRPFHYSSNNFTYPTVKRANPFTFCGVIISLPQADTHGQNVIASEILSLEHVFFNARCSYDEWNPAFEQDVA